MNKEKLWKTTLSQLEIDLSPANFKTWFTGTTILKKDENLLEIGCPSPYTKERLEKHYRKQIEKVTSQIGNKKYQLSFRVQNTKPVKENLGPLFKKEELSPQIEQKTKKGHLFPQYTFDNFIVGNNNNLAFAVAQGIVKNPGVRHNPFFLHSPVGLGKTHLIQAIGNEILSKYPEKNVLYTTSENFTNELIQAIKNRDTGSFHQKFRSVDVMLIDDIQFLAGRESSQEEFFHTFNALYMEQNQIVLTSDRSPREISKLEKRLSSRFSSGMIADMQTPDIDVRRAILQQKMDSIQLQISNEVLDLIGREVSTNIRELKAALTQIITIAQTQGTEPNLKMAQQVLGSKIDKKPPSPEAIVNKICDYYTVKPKELRGPRRPTRIVHPRQIAMYFLRTLTELSLAEIGDILGGRDHSTVLHGVKKIKKETVDNEGIRKQIGMIKTQICG